MNDPFVTIALNSSLLLGVGLALLWYSLVGATATTWFVISFFKKSAINLVTSIRVNSFNKSVILPLPKTTLSPVIKKVRA